MHRKIISLALISAAIPAGIVFAQETTVQPTPISTPAPSVKIRDQKGPGEFRPEIIRIQPQQKSEALKDRQEKFETDKCKNIESRIDTTIKRYENNQQMNERVFGQVKFRLERLAKMLEEKGYDVKQLRADIEILSGKIETLKTDYANFITSLKETQSSTCGRSQGEFVGKLGESRKVQQTIIDDRLDIRSYFQTTIKADLMAIRKQAEEKAEKNKPKRLNDVTGDSATVEVPATAPATNSDN